MKSDCNLFSQLFIAAQVRDTNLEDFFSHENHTWPPALSLHGRLRLPGNKSELLACSDPSIQPEPPSHFDAKIFDGAAMVHILPHGTSVRLTNTVTQSSFLGQRDNCKAALELTLYGTDTIQTA
jgi:hypothetical protein